MGGFYSLSYFSSTRRPAGGDRDIMDTSFMRKRLEETPTNEALALAGRSGALREFVEKETGRDGPPLLSKLSMSKR